MALEVPNDLGIELSDLKNLFSNASLAFQCFPEVIEMQQTTNNGQLWSIDLRALPQVKMREESEYKYISADQILKIGVSLSISDTVSQILPNPGSNHSHPRTCRSKNFEFEYPFGHLWP